MDAMKYMKKLRKMCNYYSERNCCEMCPLFQSELCAAPGKISDEGIKLTMGIVNQWIKEHK